MLVQIKTLHHICLHCTWTTTTGIYFTWVAKTCTSRIELAHFSHQATNKPIPTTFLDHQLAPLYQSLHLKFFMLLHFIKFTLITIIKNSIRCIIPYKRKGMCFDDTLVSLKEIALLSFYALDIVLNDLPILYHKKQLDLMCKKGHTNACNMEDD